MAAAADCRTRLDGPSVGQRRECGRSSMRASTWPQAVGILAQRGHGNRLRTDPSRRPQSASKSIDPSSISCASRSCAARRTAGGVLAATPWRRIREAGKHRAAHRHPAAGESHRLSGSTSSLPSAVVSTTSAGAACSEATRSAGVGGGGGGGFANRCENSFIARIRGLCGECRKIIQGLRVRAAPSDRFARGRTPSFPRYGGLN